MLEIYGYKFEINAPSKYILIYNLQGEKIIFLDKKHVLFMLAALIKQDYIRDFFKEVLAEYEQLKSLSDSK